MLHYITESVNFHTYFVLSDRYFSAAKVVNLAPVILPMIFGLLIGELLFLSTRIENGIRAVQKKLHFELGDADYMERFTTLLLLFCARGPSYSVHRPMA